MGWMFDLQLLSPKLKMQIKWLCSRLSLHGVVHRLHWRKERN